MSACMRWFTLFLLVFSISILVEGPAISQVKTSITKVVIDAGHGGKDPGTIGKKSQEKNIALQIALKLAEEIRSQCPAVMVICTRTTDEFIELHERAEIANRSKADLFISIHCNANPKHSFQGAETYIMGLHRTEANLEIAKKENAAILMEPDYSTNYNGFDPNSDESYITFTLFQNAFLDQSSWFASMVQDEMKDRVGMFDRGVRQAGFLVLYKTTMPSALVETGFLSNPEEEKFLISQKGQQYISSAICRAFRKFKAKMEGNGKELASLNEKKSPLRKDVFTPTTEKPVSAKDTLQAKAKGKNQSVKKDSAMQRETLASNRTNPTIDKEKPAEKTGNKPAVKTDKKTAVKTEKTAVKTETRPAEKTDTKPAAVPGNRTSLKTEKPAVKTENQPAEKTETKPVVKTDSRPAVKIENTPVEKPENKTAVKTGTKAEEVNKKPAIPEGDIVFRIQIATSPKELSVKSKKFAGLPEVWKYQHQGSFKYTTGKESSPEALAGLMSEVKGQGFKDAFIVAFHGSERITVADAKKLISEKK